MEISYEHTIDDFLAFNQYHYTHDSELRNTIRTYMRIVAGIFAFVGVLALCGLTTLTTSLAGVFFVLSIAIWFWPLPKKLPYFLERQLISACRSGAQKLGKLTLSLDEDGVHISMDHSGNLTAYQDIREVQRDASYFYLYITTVHAIIVPFRAFADQNERDTFLKILTDRISSAKNRGMR